MLSVLCVHRGVVNLLMCLDEDTVLDDVVDWRERITKAKEGASVVFEAASSARVILLVIGGFASPRGRGLLKDYKRNSLKCLPFALVGGSGGSSLSIELLGDFLQRHLLLSGRCGVGGWIRRRSCARRHCGREWRERYGGTVSL